MNLPDDDNPVRLIAGDCREVLPRVPSASVDAVITDPPYPEIDREYGRWTEAEWFDLMDAVVPECRRILKPGGSAVFILQPNNERVGRMRVWLWDFLAKWSRAWGQVQDVWWWNHTTPPTGMTITGGLLRPSLKACVWLGPHDCYRDQEAVLWEESEGNAAMRLSARFERKYRPSGMGMNKAACAAKAVERGGVTPFNVLPVSNANSSTSAGAHGHGAGTPLDLARWWVRYICPPAGTVADPFHGSGTTAVACLAERRKCLGIERKPEYIAIAEKRVAEPLGVGGLFPPSAPTATELW